MANIDTGDPKDAAGVLGDGQIETGADGCKYFQVQISSARLGPPGGLALGVTTVMGEPNRGTLEQGKAGR